MSEQSPPQPHQGLARLFYAFYYSCLGLKASLKTSPAFRQECVLALILIPVALFLPLSAVEKTLLIVPIFILLLTELLNTAIEAAVDRIGPEFHLLSGRAKDCGSAAVLVALVLLAAVWAIILMSHYF